MLKYRTELCEYIRSKVSKYADRLDDSYIDVALLEYLNNNNLLLINTKTLVNIENIDDMEFKKEYDRGAGFHSKDCCRFDDCHNRADLACTICYIDYMLIYGPYKFIKKGTIR